MSMVMNSKSVLSSHKLDWVVTASTVLFIPFANRKKNRLWECTWFTKLGFGIRLEPHFQFFHSGALKAGHRGAVQFHTAEMVTSQLCGLATCVLYFWLDLSSSHDGIRSFTPPDPRGTALGLDVMLTVPWIQLQGWEGKRERWANAHPSTLTWSDV